jgi:putative addiction module component (TIGR02574 family)
MNARVDHVLLEAMTLAPEERSLIALSLLDSLQGSGESEEAVVASWAAEARTRHDDLVAGRAQALTPDEFKIWFKSL